MEYFLLTFIRMCTLPTILLIDDDASIRRLCLRILRKLNFLSLEAATGQSGYDTFAEHADEVSAILLDLNLPDGSGIAWAEKIQGLKTDIPVIFFTGANHSASMNVGDAHRFFLKKPFSPDSMADVLRAAIETVSA